VDFVHIAALAAFLAAALFVGYTYAGYPLWLWAYTKFHCRPVRRGLALPEISVVLAVHNEGKTIVDKCRNLLAQDYPENRLHIVIVSDGSTDSTVEQIRLLEQPRILLLEYKPRRGKAWALNLGVAQARGEILAFVDARQTLAPNGIRCLVENLEDPEVGAVSGELQLVRGNEFGSAVGAYWGYEKWIRRTESEIDSVCGATGCLWAMRKSLFRPLPEGIILDDVYLPMEVVRQGYRVVFDSRAMAYDRPSQNAELEYQRKRRTLLGNYQLLRAFPWILTGENRIRFQFVSHKVCRLLVPLCALVLLFSTFLLGGAFFRLLFLVQLGLYLLGIIDRWIPAGTPLRRISSLASFSLIANLGVVSGFLSWVLGNKDVWTKAQNYDPEPNKHV
jgi:poly-beta-1,6-N-acetyl-D-glucosamine synthase